MAKQAASLATHARRREMHTNILWCNTPQMMDPVDGALTEIASAFSIPEAHGRATLGHATHHAYAETIAA